MAEHTPVTFVSLSEKVGDRDACLQWLRSRYPTLSATAVAGTTKGASGEAGGTPPSPSKHSVKLSPELENDIKACDVLRWSRFSFPSDAHQPLRSNYNNETSNPSPIRARVESDAKRAEADDVALATARVVLESSPKGSRKNGAIKHKALADRDAATADATDAPVGPVTAFDQEPSRNILREVVLKRDLERTLHDSLHTLDRDSGTKNPPRPSLGGYVAAPQRMDALRFLVFPQHHHSFFSALGTVTAAGPSGEVVRRRAETPQEVPYYLRGSVHFDVADHLKLAELEDNPDPAMAVQPARPWRQRVMEAARVSLCASYKFPADGPAASDSVEPLSRALAALWVQPAAMDVEVFTRNQRPERRYSPDSGKVEKRTLVEDGVRVAVHGANPRYSTALSATSTTIANSHLRYRGQPGGNPTDDTVTGVCLEDAYDSATQSLKAVPGAPKGTTYRLQWRAGPGVEHCSSDQRTTIFGKLSSESWLEWPVTPLRREWKVRLRNQSCLMRPLTWGGNALTADADAVAQRDVADAGHEYLWATQGPKWNPKLLRGFDNDYSNIHHSRQWYSAFSLELSKRKHKGKKTDHAEEADTEGDGADSGTGGGGATASAGLLGNANIQAFANACLVDSFREYPRASVGLSMTSDIPRVTVDAFNKIIPQKFECSFSWFVAFKERRLRTGLQSPEMPDEMQYMRLSPVETFRHMKCGLTWRL